MGLHVVSIWLIMESWEVVFLNVTCEQLYETSSEKNCWKG